MSGSSWHLGRGRTREALCQGLDGLALGRDTSAHCPVGAGKCGPGGKQARRQACLVLPPGPVCAHHPQGQRPPSCPAPRLFVRAALVTITGDPCMSVPRPRALKTHLMFLSGSPKRQGVKNRGKATEGDQGQEVTVGPPAQSQPLEPPESPELQLMAQGRST